MARLKQDAVATAQLYRRDGLRRGRRAAGRGRMARALRRAAGRRRGAATPGRRRQRDPGRRAARRPHRRRARASRPTSPGSPPATRPPSASSPTRTRASTALAAQRSTALHGGAGRPAAATSPSTRRALAESGQLGAQIESLSEQLAGAGDTVDGTGSFTHPLDGVITSPFGMRFHPILHYTKLHTGTDFAGGSVIHAADDGRVLMTDRQHGVRQLHRHRPRHGRRQAHHDRLRPPVPVPGASRATSSQGRPDRHRRPDRLRDRPAPALRGPRERRPSSTRSPSSPDTDTGGRRRQGAGWCHECGARGRSGVRAATGGGDRSRSLARWATPGWRAVRGVPPVPPPRRRPRQRHRRRAGPVGLPVAQQSAYDVRSGRMVRGPQGAFAKVPGLGAAYRALTKVLPLQRGEVVERDGRLVVRKRRQLGSGRGDDAGGQQHDQQQARAPPGRARTA